PLAAVALLFGSVALFVLVTADPHAGAPSVKVSLEPPGVRPGEAGALRPALPGDPAQPGLTTLPPGQDVPMAGASDPLVAQIAPAGR
ncbi:hypothetical protein ABTN72_19790, partial [Acinetobacter baumannii]